MEIVIGLIIGLAIGFLVGKLLTAKSAGEEKTQLIAKTQVLTSENQMLKENQAKQVNDLKLQMQNERQYARSSGRRATGNGSKSWRLCGKT